MAKTFCDLNYCSSIVNKTTDEITVIMELTSKYFFFIDKIKFVQPFEIKVFTIMCFNF